MRMGQTMSKGFLPKEAPPSLSTATLGKVAAALTASRPSGETSAARMSVARAGGLRRNTEIPNPFAQLNLAELCCAN